MNRALLLAQRLNTEVLNAVPHCQWVFTIPKRMRVYFRFDRTLLGGLCRAAYQTVCELFRLDIDGDKGVPAMVGAVQTFGDLLNWHPHIHAVVAQGLFAKNGQFLEMPKVSNLRAAQLWREQVFALLLKHHKIDEQTVASMRGWKHSGFSVDTSVRIEANDRVGMSRLVGYIGRCPLSLARMIGRTKDGKVIYRSSHAGCWPFPASGEQTVLKGVSRNFELFEPLDFLAEMTQHIPGSGEHQVRFYGWYSNKSRGMRNKKLRAALSTNPTEPLTQQQLRFRMTWAALIKLVYEVDPLKCPQCGGTMKVIAVLDNARQPDVVESILHHCGLWRASKPRASPHNSVEHSSQELSCDPDYFDKETA